MSVVFFVLSFHYQTKERRAYACSSWWVFSLIRFSRIQLVYICVNRVFIFLFILFHIYVIYINLSNKLVFTKLISKEINLHIKIF
jgi:hypothetical protein